jgi:hypothetical protein
VVSPCVITVGIIFLSIGPAILIRHYEQLLFSPTVQMTTVFVFDAVLIILVFTTVSSWVNEKSYDLVSSKYRLTTHFRANKMFRKEVESMQELKGYAGDGYLDRGVPLSLLGICVDNVISILFAMKL